MKDIQSSGSQTNLNLNASPWSYPELDYCTTMDPIIFTLQRKRISVTPNASNICSYVVDY